MFFAEHTLHREFNVHVYVALVICSLKVRSVTEVWVKCRLPSRDLRPRRFCGSSPSKGTAIRMEPQLGGSSEGWASGLSAVKVPKRGLFKCSRQ